MPINTAVGYAFDVHTISSTALSLKDLDFTDAQVEQADRARITVATQTIRYRYDGGDPTATDGHLVAVGETFFIDGAHNVQQLKLIRATGADGAVSVTLEKY